MGLRCRFSAALPGSLAHPTNNYGHLLIAQVEAGFAAHPRVTFCFKSSANSIFRHEGRVYWKLDHKLGIFAGYRVKIEFSTMFFRDNLMANR